MISNKKFEEERQALLAGATLIRPSRLKNLQCKDCAFHTKTRFEGEDGADCFSTAKDKDDPFTCLRRGLTFYNSSSPACSFIKISPLANKIRLAIDLLDKHDTH